MNDFTNTYYTTSDKEKSMKAPTKRATRRLAASIAIITALVTGGAYAAAVKPAQGFYWTGLSGSESEFNNTQCWSYYNGSTEVGKAGHPWTYFENYSPSYKGFIRTGYDNILNMVVTFAGTRGMSEELTVSAGSSVENPIVFTAKQSNYGLTSSSTLKIADTANGYLTIQSGTYQFSHIILGNASGKTGVLTIDGGSVKTTGNYTQIGAGGGNGILTVKSGASFDNINQSNNPNLTFGQGSGSSGTLNVEGGSFTIKGYVALNYYDSAKSSAVNVTDGGVLTVGRMYLNNKGTSGGTITLDGGTLKAYADAPTFLPAHENLTVTVGAGGGTIDNGNHNITIGENLGGTGGLTLKGNGKITLNGAVNYTGRTVVAPGTTLAVNQVGAKNNILDKGLVIAGIPNEGDEIFVLTKGEPDKYTISAEQVNKVTCPFAPTTTFALGEGSTNIVVATVGPTLDNYWTGAANDGDLSNSANWKSGVPTTGNANIYCTTNSTLTKGETFAPTSITFLGGSAAATVNGEFSGITQIANNSLSPVEFKDAVVFSDNVDVVQNTGTVKFTGGVTGVKLARATDIHGTYNFTQTGDLIERDNTTVKSDGVYKLLNGTFYKNLPLISVEARGKVEVKDAKMFRNQEARLLDAFNGLFVVTNEFLVSGNDASEYVTHYMCNSGSGTLVANKLHITNHACVVPAAKTIIGEGGIMREGSGYVRVWNDGSNEIGACADWTMYYNAIGSNTSVGYFSFYKHSSSTTWSDLTFDTTDYYDNTIGRTITCEAPIGADGSASAEKFRVTVKGKGKFVFANTSDTTIFSGGLIVKDTATVEVKPNAKPGKGAITLRAGTTLALTATSSTFTALANTLNLPTSGTATNRIDGVRLRSGVDHEIATVGTGSTENVVLDPTSTALGNRKAELRVEGGQLLLSIKSAGTIFIVR